MTLRKKAGKALRVATIAPIMAFLTLSVLFGLRPEIFGSWQVYLLAVLFLTVLPILGYPLQKLIPSLRAGGRETQRFLAIVMAVGGYVGGIVFCAVAGLSRELWMIMLTYLFSGLGILVLNKVFHVRASGHACGVAGPVSMLIVMAGWGALWGLLILAAVYWASLAIRRHTIPQLIWGTIVPQMAMLLSWALTPLFAPA